MSREQTKSIELREEVADAIEYFIGHGFIEEMTTDKKYYTEKLIEYAEESQKEIMRLRFLLTNANTELFKIRDVYKLQKEVIEDQKELISLLRSKLSKLRGKL
tara:strand:- start:1290 stop:1598 length:309 start_codon:yes stop_codon:yes gene_type:complete